MPLLGSFPCRPGGRAWSDSAGPLHEGRVMPPGAPGLGPIGRLFGEHRRSRVQQASRARPAGVMSADRVRLSGGGMSRERGFRHTKAAVSLFSGPISHIAVGNALQVCSFGLLATHLSTGCRAGTGRVFAEAQYLASGIRKENNLLRPLTILTLYASMVMRE